MRQPLLFWEIKIVKGAAFLQGNPFLPGRVNNESVRFFELFLAADELVDQSRESCTDERSNDEYPQ